MLDFKDDFWYSSSVPSTNFLSAYYLVKTQSNLSDRLNP